jgi:hypothetical protein
MARFTPRPLHPGERAPGAYQVRSLVGPSVDLDAVKKRKIPRVSRFLKVKDKNKVNYKQEARRCYGVFPLSNRVTYGMRLTGN